LGDANSKVKTPLSLSKLLSEVSLQTLSSFHRKLTEELENVKGALESERRLQLLQMQAISALWKKVMVLQQGSSAMSLPSAASNAPGNAELAAVLPNDIIPTNSADAIKKLTHSCLTLHTQVSSDT